MDTRYTNPAHLDSIADIQLWVSAMEAAGVPSTKEWVHLKAWLADAQKAEQDLFDHIHKNHSLWSKYRTNMKNNLPMDGE